MASPPLGQTLVNIFLLCLLFLLCYNEERWLNDSPIQYRPNYYKQYVDDFFSTLKVLPKWSNFSFSTIPLLANSSRNFAILRFESKAKVEIGNFFDTCIFDVLSCFRHANNVGSIKFTVEEE